MNPKCLNELVLEALPVFVRRGQSTFSRSVLRAEVMKLDVMKPPRAFRDKGEWKTILEALAAAGNLEYIEEHDSITLARGRNDANE